MSKSGDTSGLIPSSFDEFRSVGFWDGFFDKRQKRAFEWYGEWSNLRAVAAPLCDAGRTVLVAGCGNSELSAQMYDDGIQTITNIDFSKVVIREMMAKNVRQRPGMKWLVMDMTNMKFADRTFEVVVDKGGLDALMGEDNDEAQQAGAKYLAEVIRVLHPTGGVLLCVTLAQPHVLDAVFSAFQGRQWDTVVYKPPPPADMARAPLQPYLIVITTSGGARSAAVTASSGSGGGQGARGDSREVRLAFKTTVPPGAPDREHMALVLQTIERHNRERADARSGKAQQLPACFFDKLRPGHRTVLQLPPQPPSSASPSTSLSTNQGGTADLNKGSNRGGPAAASGSSAAATAAPVAPYQGRFQVAVCDVEGAPSGALECGVFLVPQGREHEWLFSSEEGQWQVAKSCNARRVIIAAVNRRTPPSVMPSTSAPSPTSAAIPSTSAPSPATAPAAATVAPAAPSGVWRDFADQAELQRVLSPLVVPLAPPSVRGVPKAIPFMTVGGGIGQRRVLETAHSPLSGEMVVEDIELGADSDEEEECENPASSSGRGSSSLPRWVRRLVFLSNSTRVQSEVQLSQAAAAATLTTSPSKGQTATSSLPGGGSRAGGASASGTGTKCDGGSMVLDYSRQACNYHKGIVAGLCLVAGHLQQQQHQSGCRAGGAQCLLIGLGGGTLAVYLQRYFGMQVLAVELDEVVVGLARRHFGVDGGSAAGATCAGSLQIEVGDGVAIAAQLAAQLAGQSAGQSPESSASCEAQVSTSDVERPEGQLQPPSVHVNATADEERSCVASSTRGRFDVVIVDADCGDASLPMSCPPPVFLEAAFLSSAVQLVGQSGLLAVNCVSRAPSAYQAAVRALQAHFAHVYELDVDEDVNRLLFATQLAPEAAGFSGVAPGVPLPDQAVQVAAKTVAASAVGPLNKHATSGLIRMLSCMRLLAT